MAYTSDHLAALEEALASGEKIVRFGDRWIEYRSVDEIKAAIAEVRSATTTTTTPPRVRRVRVYQDSDF